MWQEPSINASAKKREGAPFFFPHFSGPFLQYFPSFFESALKCTNLKKFLAGFVKE
jgi:hypothetical protein